MIIVIGVELVGLLLPFLLLMLICDGAAFCWCYQRNNQRHVIQNGYIDIIVEGMYRGEGVQTANAHSNSQPPNE